MQRELLVHGSFGHQHGRGRVFQHLRQALTRVARIHRHVGAARLPDRQRADQQRRRTLDTQANQGAGPHAQTTQPFGERVRAFVQLAVRECRALELARHLFGLRERDRGHQLVHAAFARKLARALVPSGNLGPIGLRHGVQVTHQGGRLLGDRAQQRFVRREPARDRRGVEQIGVVLALQLDPTIGLDGVDEQVEVLEGTRVAGDVQRDLGKASAVVRRAVDVENHRHQRQAARITRQRQLGQQFAEREALVLLRVEQPGANTAQQLRKWLGPEHAAANRQHVHTMANQARVVALALARGRNADHQVFLLAEPVDQDVEGREQRRK